MFEDIFNQIGHWVNNGRNWLSEHITVAEWADDAEEWIGDTFDSVFAEITDRVTWSVETLQAGLIGAEPPLVAILFGLLAVGFALHAAGKPPVGRDVVMFGVVAATSLWWAGSEGTTADVTTGASIVLLLLALVVTARSTPAMVIDVMVLVAVGAALFLCDSSATMAAASATVLAVVLVALSRPPTAMLACALGVGAFATLIPFVGFLQDQAAVMAVAYVGVGILALWAALRLLRGLREHRPLVGDIPFEGVILAAGTAIVFLWGEPGAMAAAFGALLLIVLAVGFAQTRAVPLHAIGLGAMTIAAFLVDDPLFVALAFGLIAWLARSPVFGLIALVGFALIDIMGLSTEAMQTLSLVLIASMISVAIGVPIGVAASYSATVSRLVRPVLDLMQTMPAFVYLIPAAGFFRVGVVPAAVATIVFAMPPAVRLTELGIRQVDREVVEAGEAFGTPPSQILTRIQIPLATPTIMAGVNQVIMLALSMVVIAGMVGAPGLGATVYRSVTSVNTGAGFAAGLGVVILAVFLDRVTAGLSRKSTSRVQHTAAH